MSLYRRSQAGAKLAILCALAAPLLLCSLEPNWAGETFNKIKQSGKVTVGTEAAFPPFEFIREGKIVGYNKTSSTTSSRISGCNWIKSTYHGRASFPASLPENSISSHRP